MPGGAQQAEGKQHRKDVEAAVEDAVTQGTGQLPAKEEKERRAENAGFEPRLEDLRVGREGGGIGLPAAVAAPGAVGKDGIVARLQFERVGLRPVAQPRRVSD